MSIPVPYIDAAGYHNPNYQSVLDGYKAAYRSIYGDDVYLEEDSQDGQWVAIEAKAYKAVCDFGEDLYNAFAPSAAQGVNLSRLIKLNGLLRKLSSFSSVDVQLVGQAGTTILNGVVQDVSGNKWSLPGSVLIPLSGTVTVTATAQTIGAIAARAGEVNQISTPTAGWQSVTNTSAATTGTPVEADSQVRARQKQSTSTPASTTMESVQGALLQLPGVNSVRLYQNSTDVTDGNGLPPHSAAFIVDGGDNLAVARTIAGKSLGCYTHGTTAVTVQDQFGIPHVIRFFRPKSVIISFKVTLRKLAGYTEDVAGMVQQALADWANANGIGNALRVARAYVPAALTDPTKTTVFDVVTVTMARDAQLTTANDVVLAFNEEPVSNPSYVQIAFSS